MMHRVDIARWKDTMLIKKEHSSLLLMDVQEKLTPYVLHSEALVSKCHWLMRLAKEVGVPIFVSEQYPQGLKKTVEPLNTFLNDYNCIDKVHFSSYQSADFVRKWHESGRKQAVLMGIETHVCVLQTALEMNAAGVQVYIVVDAVSSRHSIDHQSGLSRMRAEGIQLVTAEMVFFEWIRKAGTPEFKRLSQEFLQGA